MSIYEENGVTQQGKRSPFADAPYECAYVEPEIQKPKHTVEVKRERRGWKTVLVILLIAACCMGTAVGVTGIWQNRLDRMEAAMEDKFNALEELYAETQKPGNSVTPDQGSMTLGQVYAKNVQAVVAVNALIATNTGYGKSTGSGFIISADGYIVTNYHVINGATEVAVVTHSGDTLQAQIVGSDDTNDIALLKVEGNNLPYATIGSSNALQVGDQVAAIGNPLGELTASMTVGYISAKDRVVDTDGSVINMLQTDAAINSGNSGGPLFNMNGEVVGIITAKYSGNSSSGVSIEGLGFAIPVDDVVRTISDLRDFGYVTGAYLGVYVRDVDSSAQSYGLPAGAYVEEAISGLCAARAGIRKGDIIVNIGGFDVASVTELTRMLRRFDAGDTTSVTVFRNGKKVYLQVTLDEKPVEEKQDVPEEAPQQNEEDFRNWYDYFSDFFGYGG